jgi:tRNA threonylcarbamoyladenosine biosynthesis protein TsaB
MNVLAFDTASPSPSVCIVSAGRAFEEPLPGDRRASEELLPAVARALVASGLRLRDCTRIAVCAGPGSFTGLRVGLATAWGLGRSLAIEVEAASTLEAMAETARGENERVVAALDAGRGEIVCETFALDGARARSLGPARLLSRAAAGPLLREDRLVTLPRDLVRDGDPPAKMSVAEALARAVARAPRSRTSVAAIYSRPSAAEEKRVGP